MRDVKITDDEHIRFSRAFGPLETRRRDHGIATAHAGALAARRRR